MQEGAGPMAVARELVKLTRAKRALEANIKAIAKEIETVQAQVLDLIADGHLPAKFGEDGASVFTREDCWASAKDGDHGRLTALLTELGLVEYLPSTVNSQKISAYVREFRDEHGQVKVGGEDGLDPRLAEALQITITPKVIVNG